MSIFNFGKKDSSTNSEQSNAKKDLKKEDKKTDKKSVKISSEKKETGKQSMKDLYGSETKKITKEKKTTDGESKTSKIKEIKRSAKNSNAYRILVKPLITEKASIMGSLNKYIFAVNIKANKIEIAKAIEDVYGVNPVGVNIIKVKGKIVTRGKYTGKRKDWKKAIVTLPKGQSIQIYEGI